MEYGLERMLTQLSKMKYIIDKAVASDNIIDTLYKEDIRTPLFMIESQCRIYRKIYDKTFFEEQLSLYKRLEDAIGQYDCYYVYLNQLEKVAAPKKLIQAFEKAFEKSKRNLLAMIENDEWLSSKKIKKTIDLLENVSWKKEKDETNEIAAVYKKEVDKVNTFIKAQSFPLTQMEDQVHEIRRKLRWLSIYIHSSDGLYALQPSSANTLQISMQVPNIVNSKFNAIVPHLKYKKHINLSYPSFISLSWVIDQIGQHKDQGLLIELLHSMDEITTKDGSLALEKMGIAATETELLNKTSEAIAIFMESKSLDTLI